MAVSCWEVPASTANILALLSSPSGRRKIPDPCHDYPKKVAFLEKDAFRMEDFEFRTHQRELEDIFRIGGWDATPHTTASHKIAIGSLVTGEPSRLLWEESTPKYKRQIIHPETLWGSNIRMAGGVPLTAPVLWGVLRQDKFPGEQALLENPELARKHLENTLALATVSGRSDDFTADTDKHPKPPAQATLATLTNAGGSGAGEGRDFEIPPPGIGISYFSWLKEIIPGVREHGPLGRGWGRVGEEKRGTYAAEGGRMDPGCVRIKGFVLATTDGHIVYAPENENDAISRGFRVLEVARFSTNLIVEDARSFKSFTLARAASAKALLPGWILFPHGRGWITDLGHYSPPLEADPFKWILRCGVSHGIKTCSALIVEPSLGLTGEGGNPVISAKSLLSAVSSSPYFTLGREKAPSLWRG